MYKHILALNCRLQIEQVNSDCAESDDGPLALAFLSTSFQLQFLFATNWETPLLMRQPTLFDPEQPVPRTLFEY